MSLQAFIKQLQEQECIPFATEMSLERMPQFDTGIVTTITEEIYWYYLEVLPPKWMSGRKFAFAEGYEAFLFFWQEKDAYFAVQLSDEQTSQFCQLSGTVMG